LFVAAGAAPVSCISRLSASSGPGGVCNGKLAEREMTLAATPRQAAVMLRRVVAVTAADAEMVRCA